MYVAIIYCVTVSLRTDYYFADASMDVRMNLAK